MISSRTLIWLVAIAALATVLAVLWVNSESEQPADEPTEAELMTGDDTSSRPVPSQSETGLTTAGPVQLEAGHAELPPPDREAVAEPVLSNVEETVEPEPSPLTSNRELGQPTDNWEQPSADPIPLAQPDVSEHQPDPISQAIMEVFTEELMAQITECFHHQMNGLDIHFEDTLTLDLLARPDPLDGTQQRVDLQSLTGVNSDAGIIECATQNLSTFYVAVPPDQLDNVADDDERNLQYEFTVRLENSSDESDVGGRTTGPDAGR